MADLWSLRGLSWREWAKRTCRKSWDDEVFGQAARLAFYYFLSMFPVLLLLLILLDKFGSGASTGSRICETRFWESFEPDRENAGNGLGRNDLSPKKWVLMAFRSFRLPINRCKRWIAVRPCPRSPVAVISAKRGSCAARPHSSAPFHRPARMAFSCVAT